MLQLRMMCGKTLVVIAEIAVRRVRGTASHIGGLSVQKRSHTATVNFWYLLNVPTLAGR
jgi:hypothetical protein